MDIICIRGDASRPSDDIVEPLLSSVEAGLSRGRAELDEGSLANDQQLDTKLIDLRLGETIEVDDAVLGNWRGKLISLVHNVTIDENGNLSGSSSFTIRKPR